MVFILNAACLFAQQSEIKRIDGKDYYIHEVEKGTTLYAISKKYNVDVEDIIAANPFLEHGLKPGQNLNIPVINASTNQEEKDTLKVPKGFTEHIVQQGETLYSLGKKYQVTVREILQNNPTVAVSGLKLAQVLLIPDKFNSENFEEEDAANPVSVNATVPRAKNNIQHEVVPGETLYSLSKKYQVNADSIIAVNDGLKSGLKTGMLIIIPKQKPVEVVIVRDVMENSDTLVLNDTLLKQKVYNVALMLPFYLDMNDTLELTKKGYEDEKIYEPSKVALQFYQGALLAIDSMKKMGLSVRLYVYDTANDTTMVAEALERPEMAEMNLFIGPLYRNSFEIVSEFAKKHKISIVTPVPQSNRVLLGNPYVSKVSASKIMQIEKLSEFIVKHHINDNLFIFNKADDKDAALADHFDKVTRQRLKALPNAPIDSINEILFDKIKAEKIKILLDTGRHNVVVIPSNDHSFVSEFLTELNKLSENYRITVFGMDKWKGFENINTDYLHQLHVHITSATVISYSGDDEISYISLFREKYKTDPNLYGFLGFDIAYYYLGALGKYGVNFQQHLPGNKHRGITTSFDYFQTSMESGFENKNAFILKYEDYNLVEVE